MLFAMQKTDFYLLELFCRASHVRASINRITILESSRVTFIYIVLLTKQIVTKQLHNIKIGKLCFNTVKLQYLTLNSQFNFQVFH